jgi:Bacterial sugar transferase
MADTSANGPALRLSPSKRLTSDDIVLSRIWASHDRGASIVSPHAFVRSGRRYIRSGVVSEHAEIPCKAGMNDSAIDDFRGDTDRQKAVRYDLHYNENESPWFDLRMIAFTVIHVFRRRDGT